MADHGDTYAPEWTGPRSPCGCPINDDSFAEHPGEQCDWSPWHLNDFPGREDRFCWKCGGMETRTMDLEP